MLKLAFRNIFRNRLRTALTLLVIAIGVASIILSGGFVQDVFVQLRETTIHSQIGHMQVFREGYREFGRRDPARYVITRPQEVRKALAAVPQVKEVLERVNFSGLASTGHAELPILGEGVEPDKEARLGTALTVVAGRQMRDGDTQGAMIGEGIANALGLKPGDFLTLIISSPEGALNTLEYEITGIFRTFSKEYDERAVRIPLVSAKELILNESAHSIAVLLENTAATAAALEAASTKLVPLGYEVKPWHELADFYSKTEALYKRQFGALQLIILVMLVLGVSSTINMVIHERTGEFGTLQAVGIRKREIFRMIVLENLLLGLVGSLVGVATGVALAWALTAVGIPMPPPPGSNTGYVAAIRIVGSVLALAAATGMLAAVLASLLPARRATQISIIQALRHNI